MKRPALLTLLLLLALPSLVLAQDDARQEVAEEFISALNARDFEGMADFFSPDAKGRFLTPVGFTEASGGAEIADQFRAWFGEVASFEIAESEIETVGTKLHLFYEMRVAGPGGWAAEGEAYHGEQHVYVVFEDGLISSLDLLCSGFFPIE
jgi:ketosteroid isomerase-like protein